MRDVTARSVPRWEGKRISGYVLGLREIDQTKVAVVGGKGANLGELSRIEGIRVPVGFCVTTDAFRRIMADVPAIDEQSDSIKSRMIALLKKRADELPVALANRPAPARINVVSLDDLKEANDIFAAYRAWEDSILDKYGLVRDEEEHEERRPPGAG